MNMTSQIMFDKHSALGDDSCSILSRDIENQRYNEYQMNGMTAAAACQSRATLKAIELDNPNLHIRYGYGLLDQCSVDTDSKLRNDPNGLTHDGKKQQLFTRLYTAVPNLGRGISRPEIESRLLQGEVDESRHCTDGASWDRFVPLVACLKNDVQNDKHIIPDWTWGGEPTRDFVRRQQPCTAFSRT